MTPITAAIVIAALLIAAMFVMIVSVAETADAAETHKHTVSSANCVDGQCVKVKTTVEATV